MFGIYTVFEVESAPTKRNFADQNWKSRFLARSPPQNKYIFAPKALLESS